MSGRGRIAAWGVGLLAVGTVGSAGATTSLADQRARLPEAATTCSDPVAGVWKSHQYDPYRSQWTEFWLTIERAPGDERALQGRIVNHSWTGNADQSAPPVCAGGLEFVVSMNAQGTSAGMQVAFGGTGTWKLDELKCGDRNWSYNLDHFTGTIDPERLEFQSVNNDGGYAVNDPTLFRRIRCIGDRPPPSKEPGAPVVPPKEEGGWGCGGWW